MDTNQGDCTDYITETGWLKRCPSQCHCPMLLPQTSRNRSFLLGHALDSKPYSECLVGQVRRPGYKCQERGSLAFSFHSRKEGHWDPSTPQILGNFPTERRVGCWDSQRNDNYLLQNNTDLKGLICIYLLSAVLEDLFSPRFYL